MFEYFMYDKFYKDKSKWFIFYRNKKFKDFEQFKELLLIKTAGLSTDCYVICYDENDQIMKKWVYLLSIHYGFKYSGIDFNLNLKLFDDRLDKMFILTLKEADERKIKKLCRQYYIKPYFIYKKEEI